MAAHELPTIVAPESWDKLSELIEAEIARHSGPDKVVTSNPHLVADSALWSRWLRGKSVAASLGKGDKVAVAYHGTHSEHNVDSICRTGFDPSRRKGQALGPGEYFAEHSRMSVSYAAATKALIVSLVLVCPQMSFHSKQCILVVNNPLDVDDITFCLPILVVYDNTPSANASQAPARQTASEDGTAMNLTPTWWWLPVAS